MSATAVVAWLLTYLLHSSVLLGVSWLVCRLLGDSRFALQEVLLRAALIGSLLTATLQIGLGIEPLGGAFAVDSLAASEPIAAAVLAVDPPTTQGLERATRQPDPRGWSGISWSVLLLALWAAGSSLALLVLGRSVLDLRRLLETRRFRPAGRLVERLAHTIGLRRPVRVSTSQAIAVPFATGIRRPEICCPERVIDLAYDHQKGLFAHELAHLARRDPAWQLAYRLGEAVLFLQPLNRLVRRRLEEIAEHLTDERAVACTGDRLGLARCLVVVAHWGVADAPGMPAAAMASGPRLDRRVRHLISGAIGSGRPARWTGALLVALLAGSIVLLPAITPPIAQADPAPDVSGTAPLATWSKTGTPDQPPAPPAVPTESEPPLPESPATERPPTPVMPTEIAPSPEAAPAPEVAPLPGVSPAPLPESAPVVAAVPEAVTATPVERAPAVLPVIAPASESPAPPAPVEEPVSPVMAAPPHVEEPTQPAPATGDSKRNDARHREETRQRQRESQRERAEAEARASERASEAEAVSRASAERARELAREAANRSRLTEAERDPLRSEARELQRQAEVEARDCAERSRELAREAVERARLSEVEREELRLRAERLRSENREQVRELAERARKLAEEAEAERHAEEDPPESSQ